MDVVRHADPDAFLCAVAPMSARGEASASFFTGSAYSLKRAPPKETDRIYLATFRAGDSFGAAMQRDDGPVLIGESDITAALAFAADLARDGRTQGVPGAPTARSLARRWPSHRTGTCLGSMRQQP